MAALLGALEAILGHAEAVRAPPLHEKMHAPVCILLLSFRPPPRAGASHQMSMIIGIPGNGSLLYVRKPPIGCSRKFCAGRGPILPQDLTNPSSLRELTTSKVCTGTWSGTE